MDPWTSPNPRASTLLQLLREAQESIPSCDPPLWARGGHRQTLLGHLLPSPVRKLGGDILNVTLEHPDEQIVTTYLPGRLPLAVYLFHGLGGSAEAAYMRRTAAVAQSLGYAVFMNNHRGCGPGAGLASEPYHSGRSEDLSAVIAFGRKLLPHHLHVAIGFSLSANALLLLAARVRAQVLPDLAIAVNGPIDLDRASLRLSEGWNRIYNLNFVIELKRHLKQTLKSDRLKNTYPLRGVRTLRDFDEAYTARAGGFESRDEYYRICSARQHLPRIRIPTVLLTAEDDPFIEASLYRSAELSSSTLLHIEPHGGHMGYLTRRGQRWLDIALGAYLSAAGRIL